jgi:methionyl-tRNA formyltransferase
MNIALLGNGLEAVASARSVIESCINVLAVTDFNVLTEIVHGDTCHIPKVVTHHSELELDALDYVVLVSYAPLIDTALAKTGKFLNIHYALLPKYRGMHPLQWALINGETCIGFTLHVVDEGVDTGPIIFQDSILFSPQATYSEVKREVTCLLEYRLGSALKMYHSGSLIPRSQDNSKATYCAKRSLDDGLINWSSSAVDIYNLVRALAPPEMPGAFFYLSHERYFIASAIVETVDDYIGPTGRIVSLHNGEAIIKCGSGLIRICSLYVNRQIVPATYAMRKVGLRLSSFPIKPNPKN